MKKQKLNWFTSLLMVIIVGMAMWQFTALDENTDSFVGNEAGFDNFLESQVYIGANGKYNLSELRNWERPQGPLRVGLQVGHLDNAEVPEELDGLKRSGSGATYNNLTEKDVVLKIVQRVSLELKREGLIVDVLPATIPPGYIADAFVSVHADGSTSNSVSGFKVASPWRDYSGESVFLKDILYEEYRKSTNLLIDDNVTRRMRGYYAFNWYRYDHALHPMTPAVIIETGFLTSSRDREIIVDNPELAARGITEGILRFLGVRSL